MESKLMNLNTKNNLFIGCHDSFSSRESDIEMISIDSLSSYTSLKDLIRATSSSSSSAGNSPTIFKRIDSWREIPIKDPLLQHAAWAYLQPMSSKPDPHDRCCLWKFKDCLCGIFVRR